MGTVTRADGTRFDGMMCGLCPVSGTETDAAGACIDVVYCGSRTVAEPLCPLSAEVWQHIPSAMLRWGTTAWHS